MNPIKVDEDSPRLPPKNTDLFHRHTARLLFASKRARPDIQVCAALLLLCMRVEVPTEQDYKKLGKVISYSKETVHLSLVVGADDSGKLILNVDALSVVHPDCKSHTGACLTLGHDSILSMSSKQKINTKSLT